MSRIAIKKLHGEERRHLPLFEELERRFESVKRRAFELFESRGGEAGRDLDDWLQAEQEIMGWPAGELAEKEGVYELELTLPGFEAKDIEVAATPDDLVIHAATDSKSEQKREGATLTQFGKHEIYRSFHVAHPINVDQVAASIDKGVLHIKAPIAHEGKRVSIGVA